MGWYHSHPFDVEVHSHCFLSSTDISTQLSWQRAEDPHGNPWLAIVVGVIVLKLVVNTLLRRIRLRTKFGSCPF